MFIKTILTKEELLDHFALSTFDTEGFDYYIFNCEKNIITVELGDKEYQLQNYTILYCYYDDLDEMIRYCLTIMMGSYSLSPIILFYNMPTRDLEHGNKCLDIFSRYFNEQIEKQLKELYAVDSLIYNQSEETFKTIEIQ